MVLNREAEALSRCVLSQDQTEPLEERYYLRDLKECEESNFDEEGILRGLKRYFDIQHEEVCTRCEPEQLSKYCRSHQETAFEEREYWTINPDKLLQKWFEWVTEKKTFQSLENPEKVSGKYWKMTGTFESAPIRFYIFMSKSELNTFNFDRDTPEFGIAFLNSGIVEDSINSDRAFSWSEVLRDGFREDLSKYREKLFGSFGDRLLSIEDLQTSRTLIEDSLRDYFKSTDYSRIENNVGGNCPEAKRYELDVSAHGDFIAIKSDIEKVVVCDCGIVKDYHLHRFSNNQLASASGEEGSEELTHLVDRIQSKAKRRATVNSRIDNIKSFVNLFTGVAAITAILSLFNDIGGFANFLSGLFGGTPISTGLSYGLLSIALLSIVFVGILVFLSFYWEYTFDWSIEPFS